MTKKIICNYCGTEIKGKKIKYCPYCGESIKREEEVPEDKKEETGDFYRGFIEGMKFLKEIIESQKNIPVDVPQIIKIEKTVIKQEQPKDNVYRGYKWVQPSYPYTITWGESDGNAHTYTTSTSGNTEDYYKEYQEI